MGDTANPAAQTTLHNRDRLRTPHGPACNRHHQRHTNETSALASGPRSIACAPRSARTAAHPLDRWGHLGAHTDAFAVVAVPFHTAVLLEDDQCARLDVNTLKVEPEVQLQRLGSRRLDAAVLVLDMEEDIGRVLLGEVAMSA